MKRSKLITSVILTTLLAGTLDMIAAIISSGAKPLIICQYIASAIFGREAAFSGGYTMGLLGLLFHYCIAFGWTLLFFILYPRIKFLSKNIYLIGVVYGIFVWCMMNLVIVPMTRIVQAPFNLQKAFVGMLIIIFMIGLPIAVMAHRYYHRSLRASSPAKQV
jgi:hypothetical protein